MQHNSQPSQATPPSQTPSAPAQLAKYDYIGKIGEGTYGVVYLAVSKDNPKNYFAIKTFKTAREGDGISHTAIREIMLLRELKHENIVRLDSIHINRKEPSLHLAFDYAEHDLYEMIKYHRDKARGPIDAYVVKSVMWQLLNGLNYLHKNWIIHRDLKPSNVLVMGEGEEHGVVRIADFGLARIFQSPLKPLIDNGVVVTIWYRSPELLLGARHYTAAVDVWAAGCIMAELMILKPLFQGVEKKQLNNPFQADQLTKIYNLLGHPDPTAWPTLQHLQHWRENTENLRMRREEFPTNKLEPYIISNIKQLGDRGGGSLASIKPRCAALQLLQRMLDYNPETRITAAEALQHEYFTEDPPAGSNIFVQGKRVVAQYPQRVKQRPPGGDTQANVPSLVPQQQQPSQPANTTAPVMRPSSQPPASRKRKAAQEPHR